MGNIEFNPVIMCDVNHALEWPLRYLEVKLLFILRVSYKIDLHVGIYSSNLLTTTFSSSVGQGKSDLQKVCLRDVSKPSSVPIEKQTFLIQNQQFN